MRHPKFIIEDNVFKSAMVEFHMELANDLKKVAGGGWFDWDRTNNKVLFYSESQQFGKVSMDAIKESIEITITEGVGISSTLRLLEENDLYYYSGSTPDWSRAILIREKFDE